MREIKFRAWDKKAKEMVQESGGQSTPVWNYPFGFYTGHNDIILMQFTGLHDKNGKEIWEGDINADDNNKESEVVFYAGGFHLKYSKTEYKSLGETREFERNIIGNIYEHKN